MAKPRQNVPPLSTRERLELAQRAYREFQNQCFWHSPRDLVITEALLPFVIQGLRTHGGHCGFRIAAQLQAGSAASSPPDEGNPVCR